jgi:hypothetical protein
LCVTVAGNRQQLRDLACDFCVYKLNIEIRLSIHNQ